MWRWLADMLTHRAAEPDDERSIQAKRLAHLARIVPSVTAELRTARIRAQAVLAEQRLRQ